MLVGTINSIRSEGDPQTVACLLATQWLKPDLTPVIEYHLWRRNDLELDTVKGKLITQAYPFADQFNGTTFRIHDGQAYSSGWVEPVGSTLYTIHRAAGMPAIGQAEFLSVVNGLRVWQGVGYEVPSLISHFASQDLPDSLAALVISAFIASQRIMETTT